MDYELACLSRVMCYRDIMVTQWMGFHLPVTDDYVNIGMNVVVIIIITLLRPSG